MIPRMHGAKFPNVEAPVLDSGADLFVKERTRRLQPLCEPDDDREGWEDEQHDRQREREIDRPFDSAIKRVFERLLTQADETKAIIVEVRDRMAQLFLEVAHDQEPHPELVASGDKV